MFLCTAGQWEFSCQPHAQLYSTVVSPLCAFVCAGSPVEGGSRAVEDRKWRTEDRQIRRDVLESGETHYVHTFHNTVILIPCQRLSLGL